MILYNPNTIHQSSSTFSSQIQWWRKEQEIPHLRIRITLWATSMYVVLVSLVADPVARLVTGPKNPKIEICWPSKAKNSHKSHKGVYFCVRPRRDDREAVYMYLSRRRENLSRNVELKLRILNLAPFVRPKGDGFGSWGGTNDITLNFIYNGATNCWDFSNYASLLFVSRSSAMGG